ncbi:bifunctional folylpolyglutamate synthase/dihydrofolate synthase [Anaerosacchariphilus polymeriproducens]|uniref:tetrahydrofolate synthase n=1 Tax=Anaerosacchariphilus polymeriproducens TaxID=1812858 RepID=A0A371AWL9_9FIRM|nr:folylpolyglutamate synthase/dihydrofolate synthase family protein [Anaerosacchariphilus polymeriproducens]RDU23975.1 bifunctional folylpolyglutamate synthase/dihydrofolate synthase [Anaerosacchariphilus polymeriproducens]
MKSYQEAREYIKSTLKFGSILGLENIKELLNRLENPQEHLQFIHVAGTNGKGSIVSYLSEILKEAGYRTGKYISPTILDYREFIQVDNSWIEEENVVLGIEIIETKIREMLEEGLPHPTTFEIETALAFWYFKKKKCDIVVLETGLGGALDATNIISKAICYVFASISKDHTPFLGNTIEEIATNKSGIIKENGVVVTCEQIPSIIKILESKAIEKSCTFVVAGMDKVSKISRTPNGQSIEYRKEGQEQMKIHIPFLGTYQVQNVVTSIAAIEVLQKKNFFITNSHIINGIANTKWFGRFTKVNEKPLFFVDGAHNLDAAKNLRNTLLTYFAGKKFIYIIGVFQDKDFQGILEQTMDLCKKTYTVTAPGPRGLPAEELRSIVEEYHENVEAVQSVEEAIVKGCDSASEEDIIIAFGSLSYLGDIYRYFNRKV